MIEYRPVKYSLPVFLCVLLLNLQYDSNFEQAKFSYLLKHTP
jgi:hypothetical protein